MTFSECVLECLKDKELVSQFDRLNGTNLSLRGGNLAVGIDMATGRLESDTLKFFRFVKDCIWNRLPAQVSDK